ncbi:hypothetical protein [Neolewinella agarilytica]|uniref:Outer membrane receptor proteins, mostly Fe transport n=1 Tax=Neolewinella agarilytica TaxID=478744 RepID=A0A1H9FCM2_9BACT|nr:hypothetical protein [Neolewinella agarilytica]SEQ35048.1 hypothetical protein SAMN05444359_108158 [Neolewinella agarilytica]
MRHHLLLLIFFFAACYFGTLWGQKNQLTGIVTEISGEPLVGANLMAKDGLEGNILAFAITDSKGRYQLLLPPGLDSLWVEVKHLTQNAEGKWLPNRSQELNWQLLPRTYELPTMEVTQQAVTRRGDTLIFDVAQLREKSDQNIEQLLQRIPGITVSPEGQISYEDLPISKFYIEGLDLLEGRYAIATRNLSVDAIRDVEILERHQPIRALDSIIVPPNAAINLRLKSSITFAGTMEGGLGLSPALYDAQGTGFGFTRQQQFNAIGSVNNIGKRRANDYQNFYEDTDFRLPLLSPTLARKPFGLPTEAYLDNQEYTGSLSFLRKIKDQSQFKLNGFVVTDAIDFQGGNTTVFRDDNNAATFSESLVARQQIDRLNGRLLYEINRKRFYLNSTVEVEANQDETLGDNVVNGAFVPEQFGQEDWEVDGNFQAIVRHKQKAFQLWGNLNYQEQDVALAVAPLVVSVPELPLLTLDTARQTARRTALTGNVYTSLATRKGRWQASGRVGLKFERETLGSILQEDRSGSERLPAALFQNDTRQRILRPYFYQQLKRETDRHFWTLTLPLSLDLFSYEDRLRRGALRQNLLVTKPGLGYSYRFPKGQFLSFGYSFNLDYQRDNQLFEGYILRRNRFFDRTAADVNRSRAHQLSVSFRGNNLASTLRYQTNLSAGFTSTDLLAEASFDATGQSQSLVQERNTRRRYAWGNRLVWAVSSGFELRLNTEYTLANYPIVLNGRVSRQFYDQFSLKLEMEQVFSSAVFRLSPELVRTFSDLASLVQWQEKLGGSYYQKLPDGWGATRLQYTYQNFRNDDRTATTNLLSMSYERKVFDDNWELRLVARNLLGTETYQWSGIDVYAVSASSFRLRPRQLFVSLKRTL